jgi:hypothetical protein
MIDIIFRHEIVHDIHVTFVDLFVEAAHKCLVVLGRYVPPPFTSFPYSCEARPELAPFGLTLIICLYCPILHAGSFHPALRARSRILGVSPGHTPCPYFTKMAK